ncbi:MAG: AAA family ATPase [Clostridia bacterium]|nr:AAA family ATPase [Clostridia bacterium]
MSAGIAIMGLNGCGKTTVGRMLADALAFFRLDVEDYYFPVPGNYSLSRTAEEVQRLMEKDIAAHGHFVLSCVRCNLSDEIVKQIQLAVVLHAPAEVRASRIRQREEIRFGARVLPGGDMYESQQRFHAFAAARTEALVTESLSRLLCPVIEMDAMLPAEEITRRIIEKWSDR